MSEPAQALNRTGEANLWDKAPAWRNLTIAATLLTAVAAALPLMLPPQNQSAPPIPARTAPVPIVAAAPAQTPIPAPHIQQALPASAPVRRAPVHLAILAPAQQNPVQQPQLQAQQTQPETVCAMRPTPTAPQLIGLGTVAGFEDRALALARIQVTEAAAGGKIDPAYIDNQRVNVQIPNGQIRTFILPKGMSVQIGDRVTLQNGYRNMALPCNYIPIQIASDIGPAPAATQTAPAAALPQN